MFDVLLTEEEKRLQEEVRRFVKEKVPGSLVRAMDADQVRYPKEFMESLGAQNLLGLRFSKRWGGRGMKWTGEVAAIEEIGVLGSGMSCLYSLVSIVGEAIHHFGTSEQKEKYLKPTLEGKLCSAEALTEPRGGSDFFGATTVAKRDGKDYILNGQKRFVVGAEGADYFLVYARTDPHGEPHKSLSCLIVDRSEGVDTKYLYGLMGCRGGGAGRVVFRDVKVPKENVVGAVNGAYAVFNTMMIPERLGTAAMTIGAARPALDIATAYSTRRKAFGKTINQFQGVSFQIAEATTLLDASRTMVYATAKAVETGQSPDLVRRLVSETKKFVCDSCQKVVHNAMQVMGGIGYTNVYPIERIFRDLRLASIWTGSNEIMSAIIANEWYKEFIRTRESRLVRDYENDCAEAFAEDEKIYE